MGQRRFQVTPAVHALITDGQKLLLVRRAGSGYRDGQLALVAGHVERDESAANCLSRELLEEVGIHAESFVPLLVAHRRGENGDSDDQRIDFFFRITGYSGIPEIREPAKCTELVWADPADPPADTAPFIRDCLAAIAAGESLIELGWS